MGNELTHFISNLTTPDKAAVGDVMAGVGPAKTEVKVATEPTDVQLMSVMGLLDELRQLKEQLKLHKDQLVEGSGRQESVPPVPLAADQCQGCGTGSSARSCGGTAADRSLAQLTAIQTRMLAATHLRESRPKAKFSGGKKLDFAKHMKLLESAVDVEGITPRQKVLELQYYFEGAAFRLIEAETLRGDADAAFAGAVDKLNKKFGTRRETALEMLDELLGGKAVSDKDPNALLDFYARLSSVYSLAQETDRASDFETRSVIDAILRKKLPHLLQKWFKKSVKHQRERSADLRFVDFLSFVDEEHAVFDQMHRAMGGISTVVAGGSGGKAAPSVKVAAAGVSGAVKTLPTAAVPAGGACPACGAGHSISDCAAFQDKPMEEKRRVCITARLCYKCLVAGHSAARCAVQVVCATCGGAHHTLSHEIFAARAPVPNGPRVAVGAGGGGNA